MGLERCKSWLSEVEKDNSISEHFNWKKRSYNLDLSQHWKTGLGNKVESLPQKVNKLPEKKTLIIQPKYEEHWNEWIINCVRLYIEDSAGLCSV